MKFEEMLHKWVTTRGLEDEFPEFLEKSKPKTEGLDGRKKGNNDLNK